MNLTPVSNGYDEDLKFVVMDFVDDSVISNANPPSHTAFEFLYVGGPRIGLQTGQAGQNSIHHVIRKPIQLFLDRFGKDDAIPHLRRALRLVR